MSNTELLIECKCQLEYLSEKFTPTGTTNALLTKIEAALQNKVSDMPEWYTKEEIYDWLIHENYSEKIAQELSEKWAASNQSAFAKGWEKATNKNAGTFDYKYFQNKVSDISAEEWKVFSHTSALGLTGDYMSDCGIENGSISFYCDKPDDITNEELQEICDKLNASIVNERKDNIPADFKQVTGHDSPKEMAAYEKGREDEQQVIADRIKKWDGSDNSVMGALLKKKFDERKDNVGVFTIEDIKSAIAFGYNTGYYDGRDKTDYKRPDNGENFEEFIQSLPTQQKDESQSQNNVGVNDAVEFAEWVINEKYIFDFKKKKHFAAWNNYQELTTQELYKIFRESQPQQKEVEESEKELEERTERNMNVISDFCEHVKSEVGLVIPESAVLSFFNA